MRDRVYLQTDSGPDADLVQVEILGMQMCRHAHGDVRQAGREVHGEL